jgi:AraC-like DNA-binding protein
VIHSTVVFESAVGRVGRFRIAASDPSFHDTGPIRSHVVVFPRTPVLITHTGAATILADSTRAMIYNRGQEYRRASLAGDGDRCEWFAFETELIADAAAESDPSVRDRLDRPFTCAWAPADAATYLLQRRIYEHITGGRAVDVMWVEEAMVALAARIAPAIFGNATPPAARERTRRLHAEVTDETRRLLALRYREAPSLGEIAACVGVSPFHLARVFRRHARMPIHAYCMQLRLRAALDALDDDLTRLALDLGFSSHAHFTTAFRSSFGMAPSEIRARRWKRRRDAAT